MGQIKFMFGMSRIRSLVSLAALAAVALIVAPVVSADRFESSNYTIDANVSNSFGGSTSATSYKMESSGGESVVGNGAAGSYKLGQGYIAQLERSLQLTVQPADLLAYFPLNENTGAKIFDNFESPNSAALINSPAWVAGKIGNALDFDGVNQYADAGAGKLSALDIPGGDVQTFSMWIKAGTQSAHKDFLWKEGACKGWSFGMTSTGDIAMRFATTATDCTGAVYTTVQTSGTNYADSAWHHVSGIIDRANGNMNLFIDGASAGTKTVNTTDAGTGGNFIIGSNWNNSKPFDGIVDEVQIYNRALSTKEIANLYTAQNAGIPSSLTFATLDAASSKTVASKAIVQTDAPGYTIALSQNQNLTSGVNTIPAIASGTIATPVAWDEGTTKGLGFTVTSGNAVPAKWGTSPNFNYAAIPGTTTSFYTRSGYTGGIKDSLGLQHRLDISASQPVGDYKNNVTYTATMTP